MYHTFFLFSSSRAPELQGSEGERWSRPLEQTFIHAVTLSAELLLLLLLLLLWPLYIMNVQYPHLVLLIRTYAFVSRFWCIRVLIERIQYMPQVILVSFPSV